MILIKAEGYTIILSNFQNCIYSVALSLRLQTSIYLNKSAETFGREVGSLKASVANLRLVVCGEGEEDVVDRTRSELECPVCMEEMRPPRRCSAVS